MKIAIRQGHTILKNGQCTSANGIKSEYKIIREYAPFVIAELKKAGHTVVDVTPKDKTFDNEISDINAAIKVANDIKVDMFVSLHCNCFNGTGHGSEVLHSLANAKGKEIGTNICLELSKLGYTNRGAKIDVRGLNEIRRTAMTSVIVEPLFCDNAGDMKLYNAEKLGKAIAIGILKSN